MAKRTRNSTSSPNKPADKSVKLDICVKCNGAVSDDCIACHWCTLWEHRSCVNLKESELVMLNAGSQNIIFFCSSCLPNLTKALNLFEEQSQVDEKFESRLQSIENKLHEKMNSIEIKLQEYQKSVLSVCDTYGRGLRNHETPQSPTSDNSAANITPALTAEVQQCSTNIGRPTTDDLSNAVKSVINEEKDRNKRKLNLILHNIIESDAEAPETRKKEDLKQVMDIFDKQLNVQANISSVVRLGKKGGSNPRLLKVTVDSESEKAVVLRNTKKLQLSDTPESYRKVFITPDLTPRTRGKQGITFPIG